MRNADWHDWDNILSNDVITLLKFYSSTQGIEYVMKGKKTLNVQKAACFHCLQLSQTGNKAGSHKKASLTKWFWIILKNLIHWYLALTCEYAPI